MKKFFAKLQRIANQLIKNPLQRYKNVTAMNIVTF